MITKMKNRFIHTILGLSLGLASCSGFLDEVPLSNVADKNYYTTESDAEGAVNAIYEDIFGFLGFKFADCDYMTAKHFTKFFGTIGEVSASYTWNAGMVVVNPVDPKLPQTGDNASIIGFAMIAVAMVAAAVVTFKKVRA